MSSDGRRDQKMNFDVTICFPPYAYLFFYFRNFPGSTPFFTLFLVSPPKQWPGPLTLPFLQKHPAHSPVKQYQYSLKSK